MVGEKGWFHQQGRRHWNKSYRVGIGILPFSTLHKPISTLLNPTASYPSCYQVVQYEIHSSQEIFECGEQREPRPLR